MALPRSVAARLPTAIRHVRPAAARSWQRTSQRSGQRSYASASNKPAGEQKKSNSSDLPWIIGAVGIGVPGTYYLLPPMFKPAVETHEDHEEPVEEEKEVVEEQKEQAAEEKEKEERWAKQLKATSESDEESEGETESEKGSGADEADSKDQSDVQEGDSRGGSGAKETATKEGSGKDAAIGKIEEEAANDWDKDEKIVDRSMRMVDKQKGISNADTLHPSKPHGNKKDSQKSEGFAETTKLQGTVSRNRDLK